MRGTAPLPFFVISEPRPWITGLCSAPDHPAGLRAEIGHQAWVLAAAGTFGASPAQAVGGVGRREGEMRMIRSLLFFGILIPPPYPWLIVVGSHREILSFVRELYIGYAKVRIVQLDMIHVRPDC